MYIYLSVCITRHDFSQILKHFSNVRLVNLWEKWYDILSSRHWQWWSVKNETLWQRDDLNFPIVNFPFICTYMQQFPAASAYGVYISLGWSDIHRTSLLSLRNAVYPPPPQFAIIRWNVKQLCFSCSLKIKDRSQTVDVG